MISNKIAKKKEKILCRIVIFLAEKKGGGFYSGEYGIQNISCNNFIIFYFNMAQYMLASP